MLPGHVQGLLRRVDSGDDGPFRGERLREDAAATADIERALPAEAAEHAAKVIHAGDVELVQARERARIVPPDVRQALHEPLVLLRLGELPERRQGVAHPGVFTPTTSPSRIGTTALVTRGSVPASRLKARTPSVAGE